jgi:hypothetical protein
MLEYIIPIVLFCTVDGSVCDGKTAIDRHELEQVVLPSECLMKATIDAAKYISDFKTEHPNGEMTYRIICKRSTYKT